MTVIKGVELMRIFKRIAVGMSLVCILSSCQSVPESKDINGVSVEKPLTGYAHDDIQETGDFSGSLAGIVITTDNGQIMVDVQNVNTLETIYEGILQKKTYSAEKFRQVFCPDVSMEQGIYNGATECLVELNSGKSDTGNDWNRSIIISDSPYDDCSYTYYPLEGQFTAMDESVPDVSIQEECTAVVQSYLEQLGTSYAIDSVTTYGEGSGKYYWFDLVLNLNGIPCFTDRRSNIVVSGKVQLSEDGLGYFAIAEEFEPLDQKKVDILSANRLPEFLRENVKAKIINPNGSIRISDIRLEYKIDESDGQYSYYPVWVLSEGEKGNSHIYAAFNAVNGELEYYSGM